MIRTVLMAACLVAVAFVALACDGGGEADPTSTHTPAATATPVAELRRTGIVEVDTVIDAVASGDRATLRELILFQDIPCVGPTPANLGGPPLCLEDESFGTVVAVLRSIGCHGDYGREEGILSVISRLPPDPYAAYRTDGGYHIVYSYSPGAEAIGTGLAVEEGRITALTNHCAQGPESFIEGVARDRFVLPPLSSHRTGIPEIDAVLDALFSGDEEAIRALVAFTPVACEIEPIGLGAPPTCRADEPEKTLIDVFPHAYCEGVYIRPEDMDGRYMSLATPGASLYALYRAPESFWPPGAFVGIYTREASPDALAVSIIDGRIVGTYSGCGGTPEEFVASFEFDDILLGPLAPSSSD